MANVLVIDADERHGFDVAKQPPWSGAAAQVNAYVSLSYFLTWVTPMHPTQRTEKSIQSGMLIATIRAVTMGQSAAALSGVYVHSKS